MLPKGVGDRTLTERDRDKIAARAYEIYRARGGTDGMDMDDWLAAEREVRGDSSGDSNDDR